MSDRIVCGGYQLSIDPFTGELRMDDLMGEPPHPEAISIDLPEVERVALGSLIGNAYWNERMAKVLRNIGLFFKGLYVFIAFLDELFDHKIFWGAVIIAGMTISEVIQAIIREIRKYQIIIKRRDEEQDEKDAGEGEEIPEEKLEEVDSVAEEENEDASDAGEGFTVRVEGDEVVEEFFELPSDDSQEDEPPEEGDPPEDEEEPELELTEEAEEGGEELPEDEEEEEEGEEVEDDDWPDGDDDDDDWGGDNFGDNEVEGGGAQCAIM